MNLIEKITKDQIRTDLPNFQVGDTVNVGVKVKEGNKERVQYYEGLVIAIKGSGVGKNFIVRKMSAGIGVERTFPFNSPVIDSVTVVRKGKVRRAKPYYVRHSVKEVRIKERN